MRICEASTRPLLSGLTCVGVDVVPQESDRAEAFQA